ncbi:MAG: LacI family transcriptional regulator [Chloroflexi bacterium]|nr:MAG: LacI family transcriptional regulator [Chloroflexota bacterium]
MVTSKKRATIKDVAALAGVSYQTVSRVINNQPGVTDSTRGRVEQAIESLGYRPSLAARSLPRRRFFIIGLIIPYTADYLFRDPHLLAQISGIDAEANAHGYNVLLSTAGDSGSGLEAYERFVRNQFADGALVIETASGKAGGELLAGQDYPFVGLGYGEATSSPYTVHANDREGARRAVRHLLEQGHRRIGLINGPLTGAVVASEERLAGYRQVLAEADIPFEPALMVYGDYTRASGQAAARQLLAQPNPPTAIFALNDRMAIGAIHAIRAAGLRVPEDVAVVGFDDIPIAADFDPPLTTVRQPSKEVGRMAARMLFQLINGEAVTTAKVVLPAELIIRQST